MFRLVLSILILRTVYTQSGPTTPSFLPNSYWFALIGAKEKGDQLHIFYHNPRNGLFEGINNATKTAQGNGWLGSSDRIYANKNKIIIKTDMSRLTSKIKQSKQVLTSIILGPKLAKLFGLESSPLLLRGINYEAVLPNSSYPKCEDIEHSEYPQLAKYQITDIIQKGIVFPSECYFQSKTVSLTQFEMPREIPKFLPNPMMEFNLPSGKLKKKIGMTGNLRFCDESKIARFVRFADHPACPTDTNGGIEETHEHGSVIMFKPNPAVTRVQGFSCYWRVSFRRTYMTWTFTKQTLVQWDRNEEVPEAMCREWWIEKRCDRILATDHYPPQPYDRREKVEMKRASRDGLYMTNSPPYMVHWYVKSHDYYTYNCVGEETTIISAPPYREIATTTGGTVAYDIKRGNFSIQNKHLFESGGHFVDHSDHKRYVWDPVEASNLCTYVLHEIHQNVSRVYLNEDGNVPLPGEEINRVHNPNDTFYFVLHKKRRYMHIDPEKHRINQIEDIDHPYCISRDIGTQSDTELFHTSGGGIAAFISHEDNETSTIDAITNHVLREGTPVDVEKSILMPQSQNLIQMPCESNDDECKQDRERLQKKGKKHDRSKRAPPALRAGYLLGDEAIIEQVRYFMAGSVRRWQSSAQRANFKAWCEQNLYDHKVAKALSTIDPSPVLSAYLDEDVFARARGDVYAISQCRQLKNGEYKILPTLRGAGGTKKPTTGDEHKEEETGLSHQLCFTRPIVIFNDSHTDKEVKGQMMLDGRIIIPPAMTETCNPPSLLHFFVSGRRYTFKNYELINPPTGRAGRCNSNNTSPSNDTPVCHDEDNTNYHITEIDFNSKVQPDLVPPIDGSVPVYRPFYTDKESRSQLSFMDMLVIANRRRVLDNVVTDFMASIEAHRGGHGGNTGFDVDVVEDALTGVGWFIGEVWGFITTILANVTGRLFAIILALCVIIGGIYAFFLLNRIICLSGFSMGKKSWSKGHTSIANWRAKRRYRETEDPNYFIPNYDSDGGDNAPLIAKRRRLRGDSDDDLQF